MKTLIAVLVFAAPVLAKDKGVLYITKPETVLVRPYQRSTGTTVGPYARIRTSPYTGTLKTGKHPKY
jgi:hypothetical protein